MKMSMKFFDQYIVILFNFHLLQIIFSHYKSKIATSISGL